MNKIILFSPNGYVGSFLKKGLQNEKNIQLCEMTRDSDINKYKGDYDILIYSASVTSARHETAEKYVQDNVVTAISVMDFCKRHHVKRIIYLSSDEIYGQLNTNRISEQAVMVNPNLYGATKYLAEKIIMESGISYYILRLPGIVGRVWGKNFIYNLMDQIKNNQQLELYNLNKKFNNIVYIDDLVQFIVRLCNIQNENKSEIMLLGNIEEIKLEEIVTYLKNLYHSASPIRSIDTDYKRYFTLDVSKAVEYGYCSKGIRMILDELYHIQKG